MGHHIFHPNCNFGDLNNFGAICRFRDGCSFGANSSFNGHVEMGEKCKCENGKEFSDMLQVDCSGTTNCKVYFFKLASGDIHARYGWFSNTIDMFENEVESMCKDDKQTNLCLAAIAMARASFR